jgi:hypothetical protein
LSEEQPENQPMPTVAEETPEQRKSFENVSKNNDAQEQEALFGDHVEFHSHQDNQSAVPPQ